jgi:hypothetical protein
VSDDFDQIFEVSPRMCSVIWTKSRLGNVDGVRLEHLLWALAFMKVYSSQNALAKMVGSPSYQTFRKCSWIAIDAIGARRHDLVSVFIHFISFLICLYLTISFLFINRYAGKINLGGKKVVLARSLWTVWIVLFRSKGFLRGERTRIIT